LDAVFTPATGLEVIDLHGWVLAYEQWWGARWASVFTYSQMFVDLPDVLPVDTYQEGHYATANLIWLPFSRLGMGMEFLLGEREIRTDRRVKLTVFRPLFSTDSDPDSRALVCPVGLANSAW
jgi:hypothetical protein